PLPTDRPPSLLFQAVRTRSGASRFEGAHQGAAARGDEGACAGGSTTDRHLRKSELGILPPCLLAPASRLEKSAKQRLRRSASSFRVEAWTCLPSPAIRAPDTKTIPRCSITRAAS